MTRQPLTRYELEKFLRGEYNWHVNAPLPAWYHDPLWIGLGFLALAVGLCVVWVWM